MIETVNVKTDALEDLYRDWIEDYRFHKLSHVAIGSKVLLTENINLKKQAANGSKLSHCL
jgi:hypothetical protein